MDKPESGPERHRGVGSWFVTAIDDVFAEQVWPRARRGDLAGAAQVLGNLVLGFWRCAVVVAILAVALIVLVVSM